MTLWTIQSLSAWTELQDKGVLRAKTDRVMVESWLPAYRWMTHQMRRRLGPPPEADCQAIWAWYRWDAASAKPDLRCRGHLDTGEQGVRLKLEYPSHRAIVESWDRIFDPELDPQDAVLDGIWCQTTRLDVVGGLGKTTGMVLDAELQTIVDRLNRENALDAARVANLQREAYHIACELAARMGAEDPSVQRVVLFGSTVPGRRYRRDSDIDLAVEGGDRARLERIAADASRQVQVIGMDELRPGIRDRVLTEGVVLYEAK